MDPYAPCPCGSGKKVKFCCQKILPDIEKIERLQENQPEQALAHLERLEKSHPGSPWVAITRASIQMSQAEPAAAKISLLKFLKEHPEHPRANALYALASMQADNYPACKKAVHRAFKRCVAESPRIVGLLLESLGEHHYMSGALLAARAHLVLALRIAPLDEDRERIIRLIVRFDADTSIPFLLRSGQHIPQYDPPDNLKETFHKARHLSLLACWEEAADLLEELTEHDSTSPALWHMLGLFRAWDGDEESAAEALHRAASQYADPALAIECETIAQLLDRTHSDRVVAMRLLRYEVSSVSQLLSRLDDHSRFIRTDDDALQESEAPAAVYMILDREPPSKEELSQLTLDTTPLYHGRVAVFDAGDDDAAKDDARPVAMLTALEGESLEAAETLFTAAAQGLLTPIGPTPDEGAPGSADEQPEADIDAIGEIPLEEVPLHQNYFLPPGTPGEVRGAIISEHWRRIFEDVWLNVPQQALHDKTPLQAADDPDLRIPLEASLNILDAYLAKGRRIPPIEALRQRLNLPPLAALHLDAENPPGALSNFDLMRVDAAQLTDAQLQELVDRLQMSEYPRLLYAALEELSKRDLQGGQGADSASRRREGVFSVLALLASDAGLTDQALEWIERGRESANSAAGDRFERQLNWKIQELRVRLAYSSPDQIRPLLLDLWENYGAKLPSLRQQLKDIAARLEIEPPWDSVIVAAGANWSPGQPVTAGDAPKTLWLPGQD